MLEAFEKLGEVTWVEHRDFDLLMLHMRHVFEIELPEEEEYSERFHIFKKSYFKTLEEIDEIGKEVDDADERKEIEEAVQEGAKQYDDWLAVEFEARKYKRTDPYKTDKIYLAGMDQFPDNHQLMNSYALFLESVREDYDAAEEYYKRALRLDPNNGIILNNYGWFLGAIREDDNGADECYKRAIKADPKDADYLGYYANFLWKVREDYDSAEDYYKRAIKADPNNAENLGNYAGFLNARGRPEEAKGYLEKSLELTGNKPLILECHFYRYAHTEDVEERANGLRQVKRLIASGVRSPHFDLSKNVARAVEDGHPEPEFLAYLARVIADEADASELDRFEVWKTA